LQNWWISPCNLFGAGGRVIYVGAGTSGRIANLDAIECPPTFSTPPEWCKRLSPEGPSLHGSDRGLGRQSREGGADLKSKKLTKNDLVIGISASGATPYAHAALEFAKGKGAKTAAVVCAENSPMSRASAVTVYVAVGPESSAAPAA